ncbi:MAG: ATP-binding protein [Prevotellaceae bacterium]|jgi:AAA15 family ATPase/GTPase|nr:ATP-binding protein [Prevotellaceae bacterium]
MKESITIRNFGPIKEISIDDIRPFTVFIGQSGSGKSTIMKVVVLFQWLYKMLCIRSYLKYANISQSPFNFDFKSYLANGGLVGYLQDDTDIIYQKGKTFIHYRKKLGTSPLVPEDELSLEKMSFISDKRNLIPDILAGYNTEMNFYLNETYSDFKKAEEHVKELSLDYLNVKYQAEKINSRMQYFILDKEGAYKIKLESASSGTQTLVPLSVIMEYFSKHYDFKKRFNAIVLDYMAQNDSLKDFRAMQNIGDIKHRNIHIHIEEPELSLYPESQCDLINSIVGSCFVQAHDGYNMSVMLTTHSPYIINHLNLLIRAYDRNKLITGQANLRYENVAVYQVIDGGVKDLKLKNERLIYTNPLSDTINDIYDEYHDL